MAMVARFAVFGVSLVLLSQFLHCMTCKSTEMHSIGPMVTLFNGSEELTSFPALTQQGEEGACKSTPTPKSCLGT